MGNQLAAPQKLAVDVGELPVVVKDTLGAGRFIKTLLCVHDNGGLVVVKVYHKRGEGTPLAPYEQKLREIRQKLWGIERSHVWPPQAWRETPGSAYLLRQHLWSNLYDRLSTRPFLTTVEKRWVVFQLLQALAQAHGRGVCHGDIKCENLLLTSWGWLYLADWGPYKPTYLPADNPADFSFFFDTGGRRRCYLAPERFFEGPAAAIDAAAPLAPEMDIFAAGCCIGELLLDGRSLFDLGQLLAYRRGDSSHAREVLAAAADPQLAALAAHMIQLNPGDRWSADQYLSHWPTAGQLFPPFMREGLHPFLYGLHKLDADERVAAVCAGFPDLRRRAMSAAPDAVQPASAQGTPGLGQPAPPPLLLGSGAGDGLLAGAPPQPPPPPAPGAGAGAAAGPAGPTLLDDVNVLLSGTAVARSRLAGGSLIPPAAEDDGICLDDAAGHAPPAAAPGGGGGGGAEEGAEGAAAAAAAPAGVGAAAAAGGIVVGEVAADSWYEYERREATGSSGGGWLGESPLSQPPAGAQGGGGASAAGAGGGAGPGGAGRKEDVRLPEGGGWQWEGDWSVSVQAARTDGDGWEYRTEREGSAGVTSPAWSSECVPESTRRRRCWLRRRRRRTPAVGPLPVSAAAPQGAAAPPPCQPAAGPSALAAQGGDPAGVAAAAAGVGSEGVGGGPAVAGVCDQGMVLVVVALCSLLRGCHLLESRRACISLLYEAALLCDDDTRLQRAVPYLVTQISDSSTIVRTLALRCLVRLVASVRTLPPGDAKVYHDYLLPSLSLLPNDPEEAVRVEYALAAAHLAAAAHRHLVQMQFGGDGAAAGGGGGGARGAVAPGAGAAGGGPPDGAEGGAGGAEAGGDGDGALGSPCQAARGAGPGSMAPVRFDAEVSAVREAVERVVLDLITGARSTPDIKRALLSHSPQLAVFFGRRDINDVLLPLLITCLNAGSWQLRGAFFGAVAGIGPYGGRDSLDVFLLPCLEQALVDQEAAVVADAVGCVAAVASHLRKRNLLAAAKKIVPLLQHPAAAVRQAAISFVVAAARALPPADVYTQLRGLVLPRLAEPPLVLNDEEHLGALLRQRPPPLGATGPDAGLPPRAGKQQQPDPPSRAPDAQGGPGEQRVPQQQRPPRRGPVPPRLGLCYDLLPAPAAAVAAGGVPGSVQPCGFMLRPNAPVYAVELDAAVLGGGGGGGAASGSGSIGGAWAPQPQQAAPGAGGYGFRSDGFECSSGGGGGGTGGGVAAAGAGGAPMVKIAGAAAAGGAAGAAHTPFRTPPSESPRRAASAAGGHGADAAAACAEGGVRARPRSAHSAAVESLGVRLMVLEERRAALAERLMRGGDAGEEPGDRQELERLTNTINRLRQPAGTDVRDPCALTTHKLLALATRLAPPPGGPGGEGGRPLGAPGAGAAALSHSLLQGGFADAASPSFMGGATAAGPGVSDAVTAALSAGISGGGVPACGGPAAAVAAAAGAAGPSWRPRGVMVSHLAEHRRAVNRLALTGNGQLLLSASDDETVKVWDMRRLERDVSFRSRLTYAGQSGAILAVAGVEDGASVASASASGSLHVWRVDYTCKAGSNAPEAYTGITVRRQVSPGEGAVLDVQQWGYSPPLIIYSTQRGGVHGLDPRMERDAWVVPAPPELGVLQQVVADPSGQHWLLLGTSRGWMRLWDVRFLVQVNSWQHPGKCPIDAMAAATAAPSRLGLSAGFTPTPGAPLVYAAAGHGEIGLWDVSSGVCLQVLRTLSAEEAEAGCSDIPAALKAPASSAAGQQSRPRPSSGGGTRASGGGGGVAASLGEDLQAAAMAAASAPVGSDPQQQQQHKAGLRRSNTGGGGTAAGGGGGVDADCDGDLLDALRNGLCLQEVDHPAARPHNACALLPLGGGQLLAGGGDRVIRCWEPAWPERSYQVVGPIWPKNGIIEPSTNMLQVSSTARRYQMRHVAATPVVEEIALPPGAEGARQTRLDAAPDLGSRLRMHDACHADCITALLAAEAAHGRMLLSTSRDGVIKAWK